MRREVVVVILLCGACDEGNGNMHQLPPPTPEQVTAGKEAAAKERAAAAVAAAAAENPPVALGVRAEKIAADYDANELEADGKYKGKRIRVNGFITEVTKVLGDPLIRLRGSHGVDVLCYFPETKAPERLVALGKLRRGDLINLDCDAKGAGVMGSVSLHDCFPPTNERVKRETPELLQRRRVVRDDDDE